MSADGGTELAGDLALAHRLADAARAAILPHFRVRGLAVATKQADAYDPVTEADRGAEAAMRGLLRAERPDDAILGEEFGASGGASGRTWVIDPIDGTRAFVCGLASWGVLIGLREGGPAGRARLGLLDQPALGERFVGLAGAAPSARLHDRAGARPLAARPCAGLREATVLSTDPRLFAGAERAAFDAVAAAAQAVRFGTDCYGYAAVAMGLADLVVEAGLSAHDVQALIPIVEGAGGVVTDWSGARDPWSGRIVAAGDARAHAAALAHLRAAA